MASEEDSPKTSEGLAWRKLEVEDFGILGALTHFDARLSIHEELVTVRVNMIAGLVANPLSIIRNLVKLARASGATTLRIEGVLANERLANVLSRRYGAKSDGIIDTITISIKRGDRN